VSILPLESPGLMGMLRAVLLAALVLHLESCSPSRWLLAAAWFLAGHLCLLSPALFACVQLTVKAQGLGLLHFVLE